MSLEKIASVELPPHTGKGGFDHAAVHVGDGSLYVAHTANDAVDVIDTTTDRYLLSIPGLAGVAGVLTVESTKQVFTSNRGEDTVAVFDTRNHARLTKIKVGHRPNGLAYDPTRRILLAANVGDVAVPDSTTVSIVDVKRSEMIASVAVPGRTRWAVFDARRDAFLVNIADPAVIVVIDAKDPAKIARLVPIPARGPHGLDIDGAAGMLYCACDAGKLVCADIVSGSIIGQAELSGGPDAIFFDPVQSQVYVAIGDPGVIDIVDTRNLRVIQTVPTEYGAHTIGFEEQRRKLYALLPQTHRAAVYAIKDDR